MTAQNDTAIVQDQNQAYEYCRDNGHLDFMHKARKCEDFLAGTQWDAATKAKLEAGRRPALTINKVLPSMAVVFNEQLANRSDISFQPSNGGNPETAEALNKVYLQISQNTDLHWTDSQVFDDGVVTSRGFYDVRLNFTDNLRGEVSIDSLNSRNVLLDPDAEEYDPDKWGEVFITKWLSLNDVHRTFGRDAAKELKHQPSPNVAYGYDYIYARPGTFGGTEGYRYHHEGAPDEAHRRLYRIIERQRREVALKPHFVDVRTGDTRLIPDEMPREKIGRILEEISGLNILKLEAQVIKWVTTCNTTLLHNDLSPYKHLTVVPFFPFFRRGRTIGLIENLIDPQELYNKARSQELHVVNTTANSGWKYKTGSILNMDAEQLELRGAETGLVLEVTDVNDVEKILPNQVPTGLDRISFVAAEDVKEVSMASDSMRGFDREDVAGKATQIKSLRGSANFSKVLDNFQFSQRLVARRVLDIVQTYYSEPRLLNITRAGLIPQTEELVVNEPTPEGTIARDLTVGEYQVALTPVPARDSLQESAFEQSVAMREQGIAIPDDVIVGSSQLPNKTEIAERLRAATGADGPSEAEQQAQELDFAKQQAEIDNIDAERQQKSSQTVLNLSRAQQATEQAEAEGEADQFIELARIQAQQQTEAAKMEMEWRKHLDEVELEREKLAIERLKASKPEPKTQTRSA